MKKLSKINMKPQELRGFVNSLLIEIDEKDKRIAELQDFVRDYAIQTCNCGYPKVCSKCEEIRYAQEVLKGGEL
jgi:hypothetical protein